MTEEKLNLDFTTWEEVKKNFSSKKYKNVILFSQPRSGSTFVSNLLSKELNYVVNFFPEEFFINQVIKISDNEIHHPAISFGCGYAKIMITTHAIEGLSENDFILAAKIDQIFSV